MTRYSFESTKKRRIEEMLETDPEIKLKSGNPNFVQRKDYVIPLQNNVFIFNDLNIFFNLKIVLCNVSN